MFNLLALGWEHYAFSIPLALLSVFLMLVILVQRGRGGGLTGALGGMGGQSAFGTKAGDLFTRITIAVAAIWILLSMLTLKVLNSPVQAEVAPPAATSSDAGKEKSAADKGKEDEKGKADERAGKSAPPAAGTDGAGDTGTKTGGASSPAPSAPPTTPPSGSAAPATTPPAAAPPPAAPPAADAKSTNP